MKLRHSLILALLLTGLVASNIYVFSHISEATSRENVVVSRVIDGDTLVLKDNRRIRLLNINAPEKNSPLSIKSTKFLKSFENKSIEIEVTGMDKYGRSLARIYSPKYINLELVSLGLASKFLVQDSELNEFSSAEKNAISQGLGIWNKSVYFGCFKSKIFPKKEIVILDNVCSSLNLKNWQLKDESRKIYEFNNITLGSIRLHTSKGKDNSTDLFWNYNSNIWNNDRDSLYLFDSEGRIAHYETYGY